MMLLLIILCLLSLALLFYSYFGYGVIVSVVVFLKKIFFRRKRMPENTNLPLVTLIVTAYNEDEILEQKIANSLALDYPSHLLKFIFITDGSSDESTDIIQKYPFIQLLHSSERKGKYAAIKRAMEKVTTPVVVFSDANTLLNHSALRMMVMGWQKSLS